MALNRLFRQFAPRAKVAGNPTGSCQSLRSVGKAEVKHPTEGIDFYDLATCATEGEKSANVQIGHVESVVFHEEDLFRVVVLCRLASCLSTKENKTPCAFLVK
jgi:hypothetical protein